MSWILVGLGNPGSEYENTRHNVGRMALEHFAKLQDLPELREDPEGKQASYGAGRKNVASTTKGKIGKEIVALVAPDTYMNKSGNAVAKYVKTQRAAERLIVVYDDLDLPLGAMK